MGYKNCAVQHFEKRATDLVRQLKTAHAIAKAKEQQIQNLNGQLQQKIKKIAELEKQISEYEGEASNSTQEKFQQKESKLEEYRAQVLDSQRELAEFRQSNNDLLEQIATLKAQMKEREEQVLAAKKLLAGRTLTEQRNNDALSKKVTEIQTKTHGLDQLKPSLSVAQRNSEDLSLQLENKHQEVLKLQHQLGQLSNFSGHMRSSQYLNQAQLESRGELYHILKPLITYLFGSGHYFGSTVSDRLIVSYAISSALIGTLSRLMTSMQKRSSLVDATVLAASSAISAGLSQHLFGKQQINNMSRLIPPSLIAAGMTKMILQMLNDNNESALNTKTLFYLSCCSGVATALSEWLNTSISCNRI